MSSIPPLKRCSKCGETKPLDLFSLNRAQKDGRNNYCRDCWSIYNIERRARKGDYLRAQEKERYRRAHPIPRTLGRNRNRIRAYDREWKRAYRASNPEQHQAYVDAYNEEHRDHRRKWHREYRRTHMARMRQSWRLNKAKRRGAMDGALVDYNLILQRDGCICHICGGFVAPDDIHFDHVIPLSKGGPHTYENIKVSHSVCNLRKKAKLL